MTPGRAMKRPSEPAEETADPAKCKIAKVDRAAPSDFSSVVKSKLQSYTRTGQACDRCKVRKIRCDALPQGCSHCLNQNLECYVTDRVSGRTERRGYMQELERDKTDLLDHIRELEKLLGNNGIEVRTYDPTEFLSNYPPNIGFDSMGRPTQDPNSKDDWTQIGATLWVKNYQQKPKSRGSSEPTKMEVDHHHEDGNTGNPANGTGGLNSQPLTTINGTKLSILGSTIDMGAFEAPDMDEPTPGTQARTPLYNKSVQAMKQSLMNVNPQLHVEYPPRADAFTYAEWYFLMIYPWFPVLHKPSFLHLLTRLYDDPSFQPTVAETVMIHMVFASIYLQYGIRNPESPEQNNRLNDLSNKHYHFSLSKLFDLSTSRTFEDLQALTMICCHQRNFAKPDCSSFMTAYCLSWAFDFNLHRAFKPPGEETNLENEMRKRVWWTIVSIAMTLAGRKGRPMPIRLEESDVDFPELIADELLTKDGVDRTRTAKCAYDVGVIGFKIIPCYLEMYSTLYSAKRDRSKYVESVQKLERMLNEWEESLPKEYKPGAAGQNPIFALYVQWMSLEVRLYHRHPSMAMTSDPKMMAENSRISEEVAKEMLKTAYALFQIRSSDSTWYTLAVYFAAIFTTLVSHWERRYDINPAEIESLRQDMNKWLSILGETGKLMGCGTRHKDAAATIIDRTIAWIERDRLRRSISTPGSTPQVTQDMLKHSPHTPSYPSTAIMSDAPTNSNMNHADPHATNGVAPHRHAYYPEAAPEPNHYSIPYTDPQTAQHPAAMSYDANASFVFPNSQAAAGQAVAVQAQQHPHAQVAPQAEQTPLTAFAAQAAQAAQMGQPEMLWRQSAGPATWQDWAAAVSDTQDRYSANALMALGASAAAHRGSADGGQQVGADMSMAMAAGGMNGGAVSGAANMQWPLLVFHDGSGVNGG